MAYNEYINKLAEQISFVDTGTLVNIIKSILILLILWVIRLLLYKLIFKNITDLKVRYRWRKSIAYVMGFLSIIMIGRIWFAGIQSLATYLGLLSAGIAIALKDPIADLAGWIFIFSRKPFEVGDRIQIGSFAGDVIDLSPFMISILEIGNWVDADQSTGRIVQIPNAKIFISELVNYDKGFKYIWNEIPVVITFESNWQKAKDLLSELANGQEGQVSSKMEKQTVHDILQQSYSHRLY